MVEKRLRLGEILIDAGILQAADLQRALKLQQARGLRLGQILLQENIISEQQLVQALSRRLAIPWVRLRHVDIPDDLLRLVPVNVAEEFFLIPVYVRRTRAGERTLFVAMNDPTDEDALRFVSARAGIAAKPMVAGPSEISSAIRFYYYGEDDDAQKVEPPTRASSPPPIPPEAKPSSPAPPPVPKQKISKPPLQSPSTKSIEDFIEEDETKSAKKEPPVEKSTPNEQEISPQETIAQSEDQKAAEVHSDNEPDTTKKRRVQRELEKHMFGVGKSEQKKSVSLTLLDGTTIAFGGAQKKAVDKFTKEDLIAGLKAAAEGTPMDDFLPSNQWEDYIAAILQVLIRKHLIFFDELMEELKKSKSH